MTKVRHKALVGSVTSCVYHVFTAPAACSVVLVGITHVVVQLALIRCILLSALCVYLQAAATGIAATAAFPDSFQLTARCYCYFM
jgi:hypothetical protein